MRCLKLICFAVIFITTQFSALAQDNYLPEGRNWCTGTYLAWSDAYVHSRHGICGDTLINDTIYKKLISIHSDSYGSLRAILRQEGQKIWKRSNNQEDLFYDYSLEIGDTLTANWTSTPMVVNDVFNAFYNGETRKTIMFGTENSNQETWIEGIGSSAGFLNPKWDFYPPSDVDYWLCSANDWNLNLFNNSQQFEPCNCSNNLNLFCQEPFTFYFEQNNTSCVGLSDGSVVFYDVLDCLWPDGVWSTNRNDLTTGNYIVQVYDLMNNLNYVQIEIENPDLIHSSNDLITSEGCNSPGDGSIEVNIVDGIPPYSYDWIGENSNSNTLDNLSTGLYTLIAADSTGCRDTMEYFVPIENLWVTSNIQGSCNTPENGSIEVTVINDKSPPYFFRMDRRKLQF